MIDLAYVQRMARYNRWQNQNLYGVADTLPDDERRRERGAFFGSIHKTLSHLLWADRVWMSRFGVGREARRSAFRNRSRSIPIGSRSSASARRFDETIIALGRQARCRAGSPSDLTLYSSARQARVHQAEMAAGDASVQPPDPSSRPGALHADAGRRQAARYRFAADGGVTTMSDPSTLEQEILAAVAGAADEAALEAVRVAALGKSGSVSALLRTLGAMTPEQRKAEGPRINGLKDRVTEALAARKDALKHAALDARLNTETVDVTLPVREPPAEVGPHSSDQPGDRRTDRDLRRHGLRGRRRAGHRDRRSQLHQAQFSRGPSGPGDARHVLSSIRSRTARAAAAHAHLAGAGPHDAEPEAADPRHHPGPHLSQRLATRPTRRCSTRSRAW